MYSLLLIPVYSLLWFYVYVCFCCEVNIELTSHVLVSCLNDLPSKTFKSSICQVTKFLFLATHMHSRVPRIRASPAPTSIFWNESTIRTIRTFASSSCCPSVRVLSGLFCPAIRIFIFIFLIAAFEFGIKHEYESCEHRPKFRISFCVAWFTRSGPESSSISACVDFRDRDQMFVTLLKQSES